MKNIIIALVFIANYAFAQVDERINDLGAIRNKLNLEIGILNDSLTKIEQQIDLIKSKELLDKTSNSSIVSICRENAKLKDKPEVLGKIIKTYSKEEKTLILDYYDGYLGVSIGQDYGYMSEYWIEKTDDVIAFIKLKKAEKARLKTIADEKERIKNQDEKEKTKQEYMRKFGKETYEKLANGYYWIGMTSEMATISLGFPEEINRSVGSWGVHEQWIYGTTYLYFENDLLSSYQN